MTDIHTASSKSLDTLFSFNKSTFIMCHWMERQSWNPWMILLRWHFLLTITLQNSKLSAAICTHTSSANNTSITHSQEGRAAWYRWLHLGAKVTGKIICSVQISPGRCYYYSHKLCGSGKRNSSLKLFNHWPQINYLSALCAAAVCMAWRAKTVREE